MRRDGRCAGPELVHVCPHYVVSRLSALPVDAGGGLRSLIVALPGTI